ncbi:MAG: ATP phosphoribosyltransferase [Bulleidia sp.]|nr:ATP phosphoribosyltransferase [Bulleidia sp.]
MIRIALPKGRLGDKVYDILEQAGYSCPQIKDPDTRKLVFENPAAGVAYFCVKPTDVPVYVERGAADLGIAGKDILLEYSPDVYELLDLGIGKCRMCIAGYKDFYDDRSRALRVATKFPHIARSYYEEKGRDIDIIKLHGSIELAPILSLSDVICDIVETGTTLRENNLTVLAEVVPISARLVCNKVSWQFHQDEISKMMAALSKREAMKK